jgi:hypothetical protein
MRTLLLLGVACLAARALPAQRADAMRAGVVLPSADSIRPEPFRQATVSESRLERSAPLLSAVLPGSGQWALKQQRAVLYGALEVLMWLKVAKDKREQHDAERDFRALARDVARKNFAQSDTSGWDYYEHMREFFESGAYSLSDGAIVVPETLTTTYNGRQWELAQLSHANRDDALAQYERTAVKPGFIWSWRNAALHWDLFRKMTEQRNDAAGRWRTDLTIIAANHVLSMVDAFATLRLRAQPLATGGMVIVGSIPVSNR